MLIWPVVGISLMVISGADGSPETHMLTATNTETDKQTDTQTDKQTNRNTYTQRHCSNINIAHAKTL